MSKIPMVTARYAFSLRDHYEGCLPLLRDLLLRHLDVITQTTNLMWRRHGLYGHTRHQSRRHHRLYQPASDADDTILMQIYAAFIIQYVTRDCYTPVPALLEAMWWKDLIYRETHFRNATIPFESMALSPLYWITSSHLSDDLQHISLDPQLTFRMTYLVAPPPLPPF